MTTNKDFEIRIKVENGSVVAENLVTRNVGRSTYHNDREFDFYKGTRLALERLESKDAKWVPPYEGKLVCIDTPENDYHCRFIAGKLYDLKDNILYDLHGNVVWAFSDRITSLEQLNEVAYGTFIEFVE